MAQAPLPPVELIERVGKSRDLPDEVLAQNPWLSDPAAAYNAIGADIKSQILRALPGGWSFEGKAVLDFGCGAGRVLRQFTEEARSADFWGSDIDRPSVEWAQGALCPPFQVVLNGEQPPIDLPDEKFDLIYCISVFTHLTDRWAPWLLEMRRLLKPGGLLVATVHGAAKGYSLDRVPWHEPWDEDRIGMHVTGCGTPWDDGGPSVWHSEWWLRSHWGRALELRRVLRGEGDGAHDFVVARRDERSAPSAEELERPEPDEERELAALAYSLRQTQAEVAACRGAIDAITGSASYRWTRPLRRARARFRAATPRPRGSGLAARDRRDPGRSGW
jgi:SAM-dependent methyltransferase